MLLKDYLILDCSTLLPGPMTGQLLLKMGAKVIKVENPKLPDGARHIGQAYQELNQGKKKVFLNLLDFHDQKKFKSLLKKADGLIEGFRPKAKKKLGLDQKSLHEINPKLCVLSLTGYPENSRSKNRAGHDLNFMALSGALSMFKEMPALPLADLFSAYKGAFVMACLLNHRLKTGKGSRVSVGLFETVNELQGIWRRDFKKTRVEPKYGTTLMTGQFPCYRLYQSKDHKKIAVAAVEKKFWIRFCHLIDHPKLIEKGYAKGEKAKKVIQLIEKTIGSKSLSYWKKKFNNADCCVEPVLTYRDLF